MALVMIWHPFSHCVVCSEIVFSGYDFVFENITTLYLKITEAGLLLRILVIKKKWLDRSETKSEINKNNLKCKEKWQIEHVGCESFEYNIHFEKQIAEHTSCEKYCGYTEGHNQQDGFAVPSSPICSVLPEF